MNYRLRETGGIKSQGEIRALHTNKSLPKVWGDAVLEDLQIDPILETPKPTITEFQTAYVSGAEQDSLGNWVQAWTVTDKFKDILGEDGNVVTTAQEQINTYLGGLRENARTRLKSERDTIIDEPINNIQIGRIEDREKIQGAADEFENLILVDGKKPWVMADNTIEHLTKAEMQALTPAYITRVDAVYAAYIQASVLLDNATTKDEIDAISVRSIYEAIQ